jgi:hypothetical protein
VAIVIDSWVHEVKWLSRRLAIRTLGRRALPIPVGTHDVMRLAALRRTGSQARSRKIMYGAQAGAGE